MSSKGKDWKETKNLTPESSIDAKRRHREIFSLLMRLTERTKEEDPKSFQTSESYGAEVSLIPRRN
jgi:hypothetical protein